MKNNDNEPFFIDEKGRIIFKITKTIKKKITVSEDEMKTLLIQRHIISNSRDPLFSKRIKKSGAKSLAEYAKKLESSPSVIEYAKKMAAKINALNLIVHQRVVI